MKIDSIEVVHVSMPLIYPWRTAYGEDSSVQSILVRMESQHCVAWSEVTPLAAPQYLPEWAGGVFACIRDWLAPALVGREISSGEELQSWLSFVKGNQFAKGALDSAWWVLEALQQELPLYRLLGASRSQVDTGADYGIMDSLDDLLKAIHRGISAGFKRTKLKFGPGWDLPVLKEVRRNFPLHTFHIDCNSGYRLSDMKMFQEIDQLDLAMIEQPLGYDDLLDHSRLQKELKTPICLDESVTSLAKAIKAIELGSCQIINIKIGRVGGLTPALKIHDYCLKAGVPCWVGSMLESAIGIRINGALAMLDNFTYPGDLFPTSRFYREDLAMPEVSLTMTPSLGPQFCLGEESGHGTEPNPEMLKVHTVDRSKNLRLIS